MTASERIRAARERMEEAERMRKNEPDAETARRLGVSIGTVRAARDAQEVTLRRNLDTLTSR